MRAGSRYQNRRGDYFAAGITYFTVLSLFPLLMVGFAVAGFVLARDQSLLHTAQHKISDSVPGSMGKQLNDLVDQAISSRTGVGVIGLVGGLYSGLGWMANLRAALTEQWEQKHKQGNFIVTKLSDLGALIGLLLALVVSIGLSAISAGAITKRLLAIVHLDNAPGISVLLKAISIALAIAASWALFVWVIARLPREPVTLASAARAALLAAVVFEVFKQVAKVYLQSVLTSPAGAVFGPIVGIMVFSFFTSRIILFATAWAATSPDNLALAYTPPPDAAIIAPRVDARGSVAGAVAVFAAGMLAALGLAGVLNRRR
nr:inner membrane protein YhjD [Skermania sp. ID1734]